MPRNWKRLMAALSLTTCSLASITAQAQDQAQNTTSAHAQNAPNILLIVVDDMGFSDLGAFGGELKTPNLDRLALSGTRLTDFHTTPACSPTRAMLLTGADPHQVGLGSMDGMVTEAQKGLPSYHTSLLPNIAILPELLAQGGYRTLLSGKWHLGDKEGQDPYVRGFQRTFALLPAAHNHFGTDFTTERMKGATYSENGVMLQSLPDGFYSSDVFSQKMLEFLAEDGEAEARKPFFGYLAFSAPHTPLQAPKEAIARVKGRYDQGYDILRAQRLQRLRELGLIDAKRAYANATAPWADLREDEQALLARDMEIYAAMVENLDMNVGRVLDQLEKDGRLSNTIVVFLSDNGPEGMDFRNTEIASMRRRYEASKKDLESRGSAESYVAYGTGWASASAAPFQRYKTYASEGGTRVVAFVAGPEQYVGLAQIGRAFSTAADIAPSVLDWSGLSGKVTVPEGKVLPPQIGASLKPYLTGQSVRVHSPDYAFGTELFGSRSIRKGDWKITDMGDGQWRLYNLQKDAGETQDLSVKAPRKLREMLAEWDAYAARNTVVLPGRRFHNP